MILNAGCSAGIDLSPEVFGGIRHPQAIRVVVGDDQGAMRNTIPNLLSLNNISQVMEVEDGVEAMRNLVDRRQPNPDVIIGDLHVDKMDGIEFYN